MAETKYSAEQIEKARLARNEYMRKWREKNREKIKSAELRFWLKKAAEAEESAGR